MSSLFLIKKPDPELCPIKSLTGYVKLSVGSFINFCAPRSPNLSQTGWGTWTRTKIEGFKGPCPTIRRSPNKNTITLAPKGTFAQLLFLAPAIFVSSHHFGKALLYRPIEIEIVRVGIADEGVDNVPHLLLDILLLFRELFLLGTMEVIYHPREFPTLFEEPSGNSEWLPVWPVILLKESIELLLVLLQTGFLFYFFHMVISSPLQ